MTLRDLREDDVDTIVSYCNDPAMEVWTTVPWPYRREHALEYVHAGRRAWAEGSRFDFGIEYEGRLVGAVDLRRPVLPALAEVGFALAPAARGRGVMSRALRLVLPWGARQGIEVVQWRANAGNWASRRAAWSVGFTVEGPIAGLLEHRGRIVDGWLASMRLNADTVFTPAHPWFDPVTLTGRSVRLRTSRESDVPRYVQGMADAHNRWWLPGLPATYTEADARHQLRRDAEKAASGEALSWVITDPELDVMLGEVLVFVRSARDGQGEIGYWMHPEGRGRGLATEATFLAARHALLPLAEGGLGWNNLGLRASVDNVASQRVAEKAGFRRTGLERGIRLPPDRSARVDLVKYDMTPADLATLGYPS
ncbi:GNAT family N-acetyltransferase [Kineosporia succinea]|uniref:RimJ/RimL family protein N-acetyltransferase n=1 Tax=Kineosporia succinea TaxID=84632 RepID=A0ABT9NY62_9ACTN|nr:GNAT family N-acetyltransferase [Kineosporia succinea]MDP9825379.1 RimJ/RimL family protein N-acetyltransferase [Kineosporia succinea]